MIPFDNLITTRLQQKDQFRPCIPTPINSSAVLPAPTAYEPSSTYSGLETGALADIRASMARGMASFPRGEDVLPAAPSALRGDISPAPVGPPFTAAVPLSQIARL